MTIIQKYFCQLHSQHRSMYSGGVTYWYRISDHWQLFSRNSWENCYRTTWFTKELCYWKAVWFRKQRHYAIEDYHYSIENTTTTQL